MKAVGTYALDRFILDLGAERSRRNETQGTVARALGVHKDTLCRYERGVLVPPDPLLRQWAGHLGIRVPPDVVGRARGRSRGPQPCGTIGAYQRHVARGEAACEACHEAWRSYHADRRARLRGQRQAYLNRLAQEEGYQSMTPAYEISLQLDRFLAALRDARLTRGTPVKDIANALGLSASAITKYEKGCLAPSHTTLVRWAGILDLVTPEDVRGRPEWQPPQHGTRAGAARHRKLKEDMCHPCRVANLQQRAEYHAEALAAINKELEGVSMNPPNPEAAP